MTTLTQAQRCDLYKVGRLPSGRHWRTSPPTKLERASKETNWKKLQIKGAILALDKILSESRMDGQRKDSVLKKLYDMQEQVLNQVSRDYEALKLASEATT